MRSGVHDRVRLDGWKAIAAFLGRDKRTIMRWEAVRGLPVRRMPGNGKGSVFAFRADLEAWLAGAQAQSALNLGTPEEAVNELATAGPRRRPFPWWYVPTALVAASLMAVTLPHTLLHHRARAMAFADPDAQALYLQGRYLWNRRTPASLDSAVTAFGAAIARDPRYAAAYAGLADSYLLMREFGSMTDAQAFPKASAAADAALALDPGLAAGARASAFVRFWWSEDLPGGLSAFRAAIELDPADAQTHHWYATALTASGNQSQALTEIETARRLDPVSTAILADRGLILYQAGRIDEAISALSELVANEPLLPAAHAYLAGALLARGDPAGFLREALADARLRRDPIAEAIFAPGAAELAKAGRVAMLDAVATRAERAFGEGRFNSLGIARLEAIAGHDARARALVKAAMDRHDVGAFEASADYWLAGLGVRHAPRE